MKLSSRLTLAMVGLVVVTAVAVTWVTYRNLEAVVSPGALEQVLDASLLGGLIGILIAPVLAVIFARSLSRPLVQMTAAVEALAHGHAVAPPIEAGGESGVLARAFATMAAEMREKIAALERE